MSDIRFSCGQCGTFIKVRAELVGRFGKCPSCGHKIQIPDVDDAVQDYLAGPPLPPPPTPEVSSELVDTPVDTPSPACGQPLVVPVKLSPPSVPTVPQVEDEPEGIRRKTLVALWSIVGVVALGCILFLVWYSHSSNQAKIAVANERISQAVATANDWLVGKSSLDGDAVEQKLAYALEYDIAIDRGDGDVVLKQVRQRREMISEENRIARAQRQATAILNDAKRQVEDNRIAESIALLRKYVADPYATEKADARRLLSQAETAVSDALAFDELVAMDDTMFDRAKAAGAINDGKVTHPVLLAARNETIQRNLDRAIQRRQEIMIAEEERRWAEQLIAIKRQRQEDIDRQAAQVKGEAQEKRRLAEYEAKMAAVRNAAAVSFTDLVNFPEDYAGQLIKIESIWIDDDLRRQAEYGLFSVTVYSDNGKVVSNFFMGKRLKFVVSERFGRVLDLFFDSGMKWKTNLYCQMEKVEDMPVAKIYRIEALSRDGNVKQEFEDTYPDQD